jgi:hypothetical protein
MTEAQALLMKFATDSFHFEPDLLFPPPKQLPTPLPGARVIPMKKSGGFFAAASFSGWPLDYEVVDQERQLRSALLRDGLHPRLLSQGL